MRSYRNGTILNNSQPTKTILKEIWLHKSLVFSLQILFFHDRQRREIEKRLLCKSRREPTRYAFFLIC